MAESKLGEARFSLLLHGDELPMEQIEERLGLKATRVLHKGDVINRLPLIEATADEWVHTIQLTAHQSKDESLVALLTHLAGKNEELKALRARYVVELRLYIQSDYAQMAYAFVPETLQRLAALELPLSISTLSWGEFAI